MRLHFERYVKRSGNPSGNSLRVLAFALDALIYPDHLAETVARFADVKGMIVGGDTNLHLHRPLAFTVPLNHPVRHHTNGLMDRFETCLALADGFNRERPDARWFTHPDQHIDS